MSELSLDAGGAERGGDRVEGGGVRVVVADEERMASEADNLLGALFQQMLLHAEAAAAEEEGGIFSRGEFVGFHGVSHIRGFGPCRR